MELGFLRPQERRTVGLALGVLACVSGGYLLRGILSGDSKAVAEAKAADISRIENIERTVRRLDKNLTRVLDRLGIEEKPSP